MQVFELSLGVCFKAANCFSASLAIINIIHIIFIISADLVTKIIWSGWCGHVLLQKWNVVYEHWPPTVFCITFKMVLWLQLFSAYLIHYWIRFILWSIRSISSNTHIVNGMLPVLLLSGVCRCSRATFPMLHYILIQICFSGFYRI